LTISQIVRQKGHSAARLLRRAREVRAANGNTAMVGFLKSAMKGFTLSRKAIKHFEPAPFDRLHGVDTSGIVRIASMEISSPNYVYGAFYKGSDPEKFRVLVSRLPLGDRKFTFVDLGSGKGRTLLIASEFPFRRIIGVEFAADLHRIAEQNIRRFCGSNGNLRCSDIQSVCADAAAYAFPVEPLVLYFYEPFESPVLRQVLERLKDSYETNPRPLFILYHHAPRATILSSETAKCEHLFATCGYVTEVALASDDANLVYASTEAWPMPQLT
jgi:hypothetical protein